MTLSIFDVASGECQQKFTGHASAVYQAVFSLMTPRGSLQADTFAWLFEVKSGSRGWHSGPHCWWWSYGEDFQHRKCSLPAVLRRAWLTRLRDPAFTQQSAGPHCIWRLHCKDLSCLMGSQLGELSYWNFICKALRGARMHGSGKFWKELHCLTWKICVCTAFPRSPRQSYIYLMFCLAVAGGVLPSSLGFATLIPQKAGHFYRQRRYRGPRVSCTDGAQAMLVVEGFTSGIALQTPEDPRRQSKTCIWMPASQHQKWPTIQRIVSFIFDIWFGPDCPTRVYLPPLRLKFERLEQWMVSVWQEFLCCLSCIQLPAICPSKIIESIQHPLDFVWKGNDWIWYDPSYMEPAIGHLMAKASGSAGQSELR